MITNIPRIIDTKVSGITYCEQASKLSFSLDQEVFSDIKNRDKICTKLAMCKNGSGHDPFLKGINVLATFVMPQYWWQQAKRYHWFDIVSSQSTMHCIQHMNLNEICEEGTNPRIIEIANAYIEGYKNKQFTIEDVLKNIPQGLLLSAVVTTNYLQLKTMHSQRNTHRLPHWNTIFTNWIKELPKSHYIMGVKHD